MKNMGTSLILGMLFGIAVCLGVIMGQLSNIIILLENIK